MRILHPFNFSMIFYCFCQCDGGGLTHSRPLDPNIKPFMRLIVDRCITANFFIVLVTIASMISITSRFEGVDNRSIYR